MKGRRGFTLIELLVVIGIIALLIGILLPSLSRARKQGRTALCRTNTHALAQMLQSYYIDWGIINFGNTSYPTGFGLSVPLDLPLSWDYRLFGGQIGPFGGQNAPPVPPSQRADKALICPETQQGYPVNGPSPQNQWYNPTTGRWGSYAINFWLYADNGTYVQPQTVPSGLGYYNNLPTMNASTVPVFGDCLFSFSGPAPDEAPPADPDYPGLAPNQMQGFSINRHSMAINVAFFDGHVETTKLGYLWTLKWAKNWPRTTPAQVPAR